MHHKKGRTQRNVRAGCKMCKPWKASGVRTERIDGEKFGDHKHRTAETDWGRAEGSEAW